MTEQARSKQPTVARPKQRLQLSDLAQICSPAAAQLFERVVNLARERNYVVRWNPESVAVRATHPYTNQGMTFIQGWIYSEELNFYFGEMKLPNQVALPLRQEILQTGMFTESGQHTLKGICITETNAQAILNAYRMILDRIDVLLQDTSIWTK
jgi:hypothetical protein